MLLHPLGLVPPVRVLSTFGLLSRSAARPSARASHGFDLVRSCNWRELRSTRQNHHQSISSGLDLSWNRQNRATVQWHHVGLNGADFVDQRDVLCGASGRMYFLLCMYNNALNCYNVISNVYARLCASFFQKTNASYLFLKSNHCSGVEKGRSPWHRPQSLPLLRQGTSRRAPCGVGCRATRFCCDKQCFTNTTL